ncbi:hypothetical protein BS639_03470 [Rouxiella silvae]|uniref:Uncharacterized protein n=1 Tax=Rouxiella silvae TaxID=1646373 RepID=A0ABX3U537_9GAMM|nr:hypothetical protein BS639_03470 [Rouxiella silvae]
MSQYLLGASKAKILIDNSARMLRREEKDCQPATCLISQHFGMNFNHPSTCEVLTREAFFGYTLLQT